MYLYSVPVKVVEVVVVIVVIVVVITVDNANNIKHSIDRDYSER